MCAFGDLQRDVAFGDVLHEVMCAPAGAHCAPAGAL